MRRLRLPLLLLVGATLVVSLGACSDGGSATGPATFTPSFDEDATKEELEELQERIEELIEALFPEPEFEEAKELFETTSELVDKGEGSEAEVADARDVMFELVVLTLGTDLLEPEELGLTKEEAQAELFDTLFEFVGLEAAGVDPAILSGDVDGAVQVVDSDGGEVVSEQEEAAADFPEGALDEPALVVIRRVDVADASDCLPTNRPQAEGCYEFSTEPPQTFNVDVRVEMCFDTSDFTQEQIDRSRIYQFDEGDSNIRALENAQATLINCTEFQANASPSRLGSLAKASWTTFQRLVGPWFSPPSLHAADTGLGGLTDSFSRFGWAGSSVLIYGPSLTPLDATRGRTDNEETLATGEGHFVTVVDGSTWVGLNATGPGGFGDFDVLVFGDGPGDLSAAESNTATWGGVVTGPAVVSAIHAGFHQCDLSLDQCLDQNAEQFQNPEARTLIRQAINWAGLGTTTGAYISLDEQFQSAGDPGVSIDFLNGIGDFEAVGFDPLIVEDPKFDEVVITQSAHPVVAGLTGADLSNWFASYHQLFSSVPAGFTTVAEGFRRVDTSENSEDEATNFPVIVVRP